MCSTCAPFVILQTSTRKSSSFQTVCSMSAVMVSILVNCAPSGEMHNYCTPHIIKENFENFLIHRCNYILLSQVYCVWQVVKTPTNILNNPVFFVPTSKYTRNFQGLCWTKWHAGKSFFSPRHWIPPCSHNSVILPLLHTHISLTTNAVPGCW